MVKKTVYVCGDDVYDSMCEISRTGSMVVVVPDSDAEMIGIDLMSVVEIAGDMTEIFLRNGGARPGTISALEEFVRDSREYIKVVSVGKLR